jgi:hypothetical protein
MIRALTILFAFALLWAAVVAALFVGYADLPDPSLRCVPGTLDRLAARLPGQVSTPGETSRAHAGRRRPLSDAPRPPDTGDAPHFDPAGRAVRARADEVVGIAAQYDVRFV